MAGPLFLAASWVQAHAGEGCMHVCLRMVGVRTRAEAHAREWDAEFSWLRTLRLGSGTVREMCASDPV